MKFFDISGFFLILKEIIKILPKNGKFTASILSLSLILPSILVLSFIHFHKSVTGRFIRSYTDPGSSSGLSHSIQIPIYLCLTLIIQAASLLVFYAVFRMLGIATILVSSASCSGLDLSWDELFTGIKRTWRKLPFYAGFQGSPKWTRYPSLAFFPAAVLVVARPNIFTILGAITIGAVTFVFQMYESVVFVLTHVVSVLEEVSPGEAWERAGNLVKGHRAKGFSINVLFNLVLLLVFGLVWVSKVGATACVLWFVNSCSIWNNCVLAVYTVFYFRCKKDCGEGMRKLNGDLEYTPLATTLVGNDVP